MKVIFAGTPDFAAVALKALVDAGHDVALVLTQPDRPSGRGLHAAASPVKRLAQALGIPVSQPATLKSPESVTPVTAVGADVMVVAAYGLISPRDVLALPRLGCINIHASLLPRWRGAAPIQRALLAGDTATGISIMQMDEGLDTGPVLLQEPLPIAAHDTAQTLHDKLAVLGAQLIVRALEMPHPAEPQDNTRATYATKIDKREARIDWTEPAEALDRRIRAFNPTPGAASAHGELPLKIWRAELAAAERATPGEVRGIDRDGITVACGFATALKILELQRAGGKRLASSAFLAGHAIKIGDVLGP